MVGLDVGPEQLAELVGERLQARVVQPRLALTQVVDQQVTHRDAGDLVAVDQLVGTALAFRTERREADGRRIFEDPRLAHDPVEQSGTRWRLVTAVCLRVEQLHDVADRDLGERPTLGRDDQRAAIQRAGSSGRGDPRVGLACFAQAGKALGVA